jgi:hypothetical protein
MPDKSKKKSKATGLYKRCRHWNWDQCSDPWWGRFRGRRVNLARWAQIRIPSKDLARATLGRMIDRVTSGTFNPRGEQTILSGEGMTFATFLDEYETRHVEQDGLSSNSTSAYLAVFRRAFGDQGLVPLSKAPYVWESWLKDTQAEKEWSAASFNRYYQHGRAAFNWALKRKLVAENPFLAFEPKAETARRNVRITQDQEQALLDQCALLGLAVNQKGRKLSPEAVSEIRIRAARGEPQKALAEAFGISRATRSPRSSTCSSGGHGRALIVHPRRQAAFLVAFHGVGGQGDDRQVGARVCLPRTDDPGDLETIRTARSTDQSSVS